MMRITETGTLITLNKSIALMTDGETYIGRHFIAKPVKNHDSVSAEWEILSFISANNRGIKKTVEPATRPVVTILDSMLISKQEKVGRG